MDFHLSPDDHRYTLDGEVIPSLTQMLDADGCNEHLKEVPSDTLKAKAKWGTSLHLALQRVEYGYGVIEGFQVHSANWLDACRNMGWGNPAEGKLPIWKCCEIPQLAQVEGFVFGFTPDRAAPEAVVEIKGTYAPHYSHGIQTALQVIGMGYPKSTPRWIAYFSMDGLRRIHPCGDTILRDGQRLSVWDEAERIIFDHAAMMGKGEI